MIDLKHRSGPRLLIVVDEAKIHHGVRMDCRTCPVALAIQHALPFATRIQVTPGIAYIDLETAAGLLVVRFDLDHDIARWIINFDGCNEVGPIGFALPMSLDDPTHAELIRQFDEYQRVRQMFPTEERS